MWEIIKSIWNAFTACMRRQLDNEIETIIERRIEDYLPHMAGLDKTPLIINFNVDSPHHSPSRDQIGRHHVRPHR